MLALLFDPGFVAGNITGFLLGALSSCGLVYSGFRAHERRLQLETQRIRASTAAAEAARHWHGASAANDDRTRPPRAQLRGGPR